MERDIEANVAVRDMHELMLYHELHGMLATARLTFTSALQRKESRGSHYREDYTETDGEHWNVWLKSSFKDGKIVVEANPSRLKSSNAMAGRPPPLGPAIHFILSKNRSSPCPSFP